MDFHDGLSADLPSPRDDEPASLRDDIMDELADHLACIYRRELLRGADSKLARKRVLDRFGDPAAMARRLWFDAMKGKIMAQRILVSCCVLLTLISLALAGVMWMQVIDSRRMAAMMTARAEHQLHEAQQAQEQMLKQLSALSKAVENPRSPDWIPVSFKLAQERLDAPPGVGFQAALGRGSGGSNKPEAIQRVSDANGMIDFGVVQPGDWEFRLTRPSRGAISWRTIGTLNVLPGTKIERAIVCPDVTAGPIPVNIHLNWPADLAEEQLCVIASLTHQGFTYQPMIHWNLFIPYLMRPDGCSTRFVLCGPTKDRVQDVFPDRVFLGGGGATSGVAGFSTETPETRTDWAPPIHVTIGGVDIEQVPKPLTWELGTYRLTRLAILRPSWEQVRDPMGPLEPSGAFDLVLHINGVSTQAQDSSFGVFPLDQPFVAGGMGARSTERSRVLVSPSFSNTPANTFEVRKGRVNDWSITLNEDTIKSIRDRLASDDRERLRKAADDGPQNAAQQEQKKGKEADKKPK
jgi:hypothetical protein